MKICLDGLWKVHVRCSDNGRHMTTSRLTLNYPPTTRRLTGSKGNKQFSLLASRMTSTVNVKG